MKATLLGVSCDFYRCDLGGRCAGIHIRICRCLLFLVFANFRLWRGWLKWCSTFVSKGHSRSTSTHLVSVRDVKRCNVNRVHFEVCLTWIDCRGSFDLWIWCESPFLKRGESWSNHAPEPTKKLTALHFLHAAVKRSHGNVFFPPPDWILKYWTVILNGGNPMNNN